MASAYAFAVQAPVASGVVRSVDASAAQAMPGVLAVLTCTDPPQLGSPDNAELAVLQTREIAYRGQLIAAVVADTLENARAAAEAVRADCAARPHDVRLRADHPGLYTPDKVNPNFPAVTEYGDVAAGAGRRGSARGHDLHDAGAAQQPDGAARRARRLGYRRRR